MVIVVKFAQKEFIIRKLITDILELGVKKYQFLATDIDFILI